jgi:hypothetical protein
MRHELHYCALCGSAAIASRSENERIAESACRTCGGIVRVEFNPPDAPNIRGRIDVIVEPWSRRKRSAAVESTVARATVA